MSVAHILILPPPSVVLRGLNADQHLLVLADTNALSLHDLDVLQAAQDVMLDLESGLHAELGSLFDGERLRLQRLKRARY